MSPGELAKVITQQYEEYYKNEEVKMTQQNKMSQQNVTQSALDLGQIKSLADSINKLAEILIKDQSSVTPGVSAASQKVQKFTMLEYVDLLSFLQQLTKWLPDNDDIKGVVKEISDKLEGASNPFVIANAKFGDGVKDANGVSIYFPADKYADSPDYADLLFSKDCKWNEFLTKLFST